MLASREDVSLHLRYLCQLPSPDIYEWNAMWAYGNHFRCESKTVGNPHISYDSGIAAVAITTCQSSSRDIRPIETILQYVGVVRGIMRLSYGTLKVNVMTCSWIRPNLVGRPTIRKDPHGFWLVKKGAFQPPNMEPYILPAHAAQVSIRYFIYTTYNVLLFVCVLL